MRQSFVGTLRITRGRFKKIVVADTQGNEYEVNGQQAVLAFPGDKVKVELSRPSWAGRFGRPAEGGAGRHGRKGRAILVADITDVLERGRSTLVGRYQTTGRRAYIVPKDREFIPPIEIPADKDIREGAVVAIELGANPNLVTGKVITVWNDPDAPRAVIEQLIFERDLPREFPPAVLKEAADYPDEIPRDVIADRVDLRKMTVVVIDPADAKDHDDAVSWQPDGHGGGRLGVHIADVSWYVRPGRPLDEEARARGVSVYLTDRVLPMLPPRLSADLCSLMEGKDRLARTAFIDYDAAGRVLGGEMVQSVIRPTVSLSYEQAWVIMQDKASRHPHAATLHAMHAISEILRRNRFEEGSLDFSFPETKVIHDETGEPVEMRQRIGDPSHWLVEEFMIAANQFVGQMLTRAGLGVWRIHEPPEMEDVAELEEFLKGMGIKLRRGSKSRDLHPKDFQELLRRFKGTKEEYVVSKKVLQALRLAVYSEDNVGHFGLALQDYAHFTSPIRRYADLLVHRLTDKRTPHRYTLRSLGEMALTTSQLERRAQEAEWACVKKMGLRYMSKRVGQTFPGTIARIERFGAFVSLDNLGIDGLIRMEEFGDDRYWVAEDGSSLRGQRSGHTFRIGDKINVVVMRVDLQEDHLDLALAGFGVSSVQPPDRGSGPPRGRRG